MWNIKFSTFLNKNFIGTKQYPYLAITVPTQGGNKYGNDLTKEINFIQLLKVTKLLTQSITKEINKSFIILAYYKYSDN